jgi:Superinfection immunity protein
VLDNLFTPIHLLILLLLVGIYLLPTWISIKRNHPHHVYIALINIFLGSTGIGWIIALLWALNGQSLVLQQPSAKQQ